MQKSTTTKGASKTDLFFSEEFNRLKVDTSGLIGLWSFPESCLQQKALTSGEPPTGQKASRRSSCTDLETDSKVISCEIAYDDLRSLFLAKLQTQKSFLRRLPSSKIGLLYTDAASTIMTRSFLEKSLL